MEITYIKCGDVYLPDLIIEDDATTIGKYGRMRKRYLKEHRSALYSSTRRKRQPKNCEGMSRVWLLLSSRKQGRNAMQPALPAEQEVYKSSRSSSRRSDVSQKDACKMIARFGFFIRSAFKMKAGFLVLPIKPNG